MFGIFKNQRPLKIVVTDTEWNAFGDPTSTYHQWLYQILQSEGGISANVPPGVYHFSARVSWFRVISNLEPASE